jgi:tetratricopeptide (TPR) repeat protein
MTMAAIDPYAPCPCGSGKKFKWCCHKVESYADRSQRLAESGQHEAALAALNEGLVKVPDNAWLLLRKALLLIAQHDVEQAKACVELVVRRQPEHVPASILLIRLVEVTEGPAAAAAHLQQTLSHIKPESRDALFKVTTSVGEALGRAGLVPAALAHFELAEQLNPDASSMVQATSRMVQSNPSISPWLKQPYTLTDVPAGVSGAGRAQFEQALGWAREGLWSSAAAAFELLSADPELGLEADRNLGLCRLWLGDVAAAVAALGRWIDRAEETTEAIDLAVVCLLLDPSDDPDPVEQLQLTWPLRDRETLLQHLSDQPVIVSGGKRLLDPEDDESPEMEIFHWLDRPKIEAGIGLTRQEIPLVLGDVLVGTDTIVLETFDDGQLNALIDRFAVLMGTAVPPAQPRTKTIDKLDRSSYAMSWHWYMPPDLSEKEKRRLSTEQHTYLLTDIWPETPLRQLGGRSPMQLAEAGDKKTLVRAALLAQETSGECAGETADFAPVRLRLGVLPEPLIDPATVQIDRVPLGRLKLVPLSELDDDRLAELYTKARRFSLPGVTDRAALEIVERPNLLASDKVDRQQLYSDLASAAVDQHDRSAALEWAGRGRAADDPQQRPEGPAFWDMLTVWIRAMLDPFEEWVPELSAVLDRHRANDKASSVIISRLLEMGLVMPISHPDRPNEIMLDTRPLQQLLSLYGPKVTTSSGYLNVSATRGEIWTPGTAAGGTSIWTPGSDVGAGASAKSRIIVP